MHTAAAITQEVVLPFREKPFAVSTSKPRPSLTTTANTKHYTLTSDLLTGNDLIDSEHIELFDAINNLLDACSSGQGRQQINDTVDFLADYVDKHFSDEEQLQRQYSYPNYDSHHDFHTNYKSKVRLLASHLHTDGPTMQNLSDLNQLVSILIAHIRQEDKRVAAHVKASS